MTQKRYKKPSKKPTWLERKLKKKDDTPQMMLLRIGGEVFGDIQKLKSQGRSDNSRAMKTLRRRERDVAEKFKALGAVSLI